MCAGVDADSVYMACLHAMVYRGALRPDTAPYVAPGANASALKEIADQQSALPAASRPRVPRVAAHVLHDVAEAQEMAVFACERLEHDADDFERRFMRTGRLDLVVRHVLPALLIGALLAFLGVATLFWQLTGEFRTSL